MWWDGDWMACSQSLLVLSCVSGGWGLNNAEYTFGNKIIVTRLTDNNRCEITTGWAPWCLASWRAPIVEIAAYQGLSEMESEIYIVRGCLLLCRVNWNFWKRRQCLPIWEFEIFCRAILISFQHPSLILLNNVFVIHNFSLNMRVVSRTREHISSSMVRMNELDIEFIWVNLSCSLSVPAGYKWCLFFFMRPVTNLPRGNWSSLKDGDGAAF